MFATQMAIIHLNSPSFLYNHRSIHAERAYDSSLRLASFIWHRDPYNQSISNFYRLNIPNLLI
jgi:hypothetical protein